MHDDFLFGLVILAGMLTILAIGAYDRRQRERDRRRSVHPATRQLRGERR